MENKKRIWKKVCIIIIAFIVTSFLLFAGCCAWILSDPEGNFGRYNPYSQQEVLEIVETEYKKDFSILSCKEEGSGYCYTVGVNGVPGLTFSFYDYSDGFAGWYAFDNFGDAVLVYSAEKCGLEAVLCSETLHRLVIYGEDENTEEFSEKLEKTFNMYFEIFDYCKGDIRKYSSYNPQHEGLRTDFRTNEYGKDYVVYGKNFDGYIPKEAFYKGIKSKEINAILSDTSGLFNSAVCHRILTT